MTPPPTGLRATVTPAAARHYLRLLGDGDEDAAVQVAVGLCVDGVPPVRVMIDLIARAQGRVGELWAANTWTIAREHAATAISERALVAVARTAAAASPPARGRIVIACVDGEWHALPVRILAEVLRLDGWRVDFLGANVPGPHLITHLHQTGPDAVALSCMLPTRLPRAHQAITACRSAGVPVIAGGRGFGTDGRHAVHLGADAWAPDAEEAAGLLARRWPPPAGYADLHTGFLGDDEYTYVARQRPELIRTALTRLAPASPAGTGGSDATASDATASDATASDATAEELGHIVDFLAAALFVGDAGVFSDFVSWTSQVLAARSVSTDVLVAGLTVCREQLGDFPRARAMLDAGITDAAGGSR